MFSQSTTQKRLTKLKAHEIIEALGQDALLLFAIVIAVVPLVKKVNISPILGFLGMGFILGPAGFGLLRNVKDLDSLGADLRCNWCWAKVGFNLGRLCILSY